MGGSSRAPPQGGPMGEAVQGPRLPRSGAERSEAGPTTEGLGLPRIYLFIGFPRILKDFY